MVSYCCEKQCIIAPRSQVDGIACRECRACSYCHCQCESHISRYCCRLRCRRAGKNSDGVYRDNSCDFCGVLVSIRAMPWETLACRCDCVTWTERAVEHMWAALPYYNESERQRSFESSTASTEEARSFATVGFAYDARVCMARCWQCLVAIPIVGIMDARNQLDRHLLVSPKCPFALEVLRAKSLAGNFNIQSRRVCGCTNNVTGNCGKPGHIWHRMVLYSRENDISENRTTTTTTTKK